MDDETILAVAAITLIFAGLAAFAAACLLNAPDLYVLSIGLVLISVVVATI